MIDLDKLSRIGFGSYRLNQASSDHARALRLALQQGCTLFDTSSNYTDGDSERLIGAALRDNPQHPAFVITKAGYIQGANFQRFLQLQERGLARQEFVHIEDDFYHSIHPDFLQDQIQQSLKRLGRKHLDAFLLHSPEYYYTLNNEQTSATEYYRRIGQAFEFLEDQVKKGIIRYYGISSNSFPCATSEPTTTSLVRVLQEAKQVSSTHHFKFIQFPFNFGERGAVLPHDSGSSLIDLAHANELICLSNRPLTINTPNGAVYLGAATQPLEPASISQGTANFERLEVMVEQQLRKHGLEEKATDFFILKHLQTEWMRFESLKAVDILFQKYVLPLIDQLFPEGMSTPDRQILHAFNLNCKQCAQQNISASAQRYVQTLVETGQLPTPSAASLVTDVCEAYLALGVDHVLLGMRTPAYVQSVASLLSPHCSIHKF